LDHSRIVGYLTVVAYYRATGARLWRPVYAETRSAGAYAADASFAIDTKSGTNTNTSCTDNGKDRHAYDNYNFNLPATALIEGIEVRLAARAYTTHSRLARLKLSRC
jgi:hypothetical protein